LRGSQQPGRAQASGRARKNDRPGAHGNRAIRTCVRLPCAARERFLPADCFAARGERAAWCRRGVAEGSYALACFIFRFLRRPRLRHHDPFLSGPDFQPRADRGQHTLANHQPGRVLRGHLAATLRTEALHGPGRRVARRRGAGAEEVRGAGVENGAQRGAYRRAETSPDLY